MLCRIKKLEEDIKDLAARYVAACREVDWADREVEAARERRNDLNVERNELAVALRRHVGDNIPQRTIVLSDAVVVVHQHLVTLAGGVIR